MAESQHVLAPPAKAAVFLVCTVSAGGEQRVRGLLGGLADLTRSVGYRAPDGGLSCVAGIGSATWDRLFDGPSPRGLHPFAPLTGPRHRAPATPGDLLFHVRAGRMDLCFELAQLIAGRLRGAVDVVDEVHGFKSFDERDLLGFVDGTANPVGERAARAVLVGDEDPGFTGGSYVVVQKYLHDLTAWNALSTEAQENVVGRTKPDNIELPDDVKPADSHVALTTVKDEDGNERKIVRDNMPFGRVGQEEFGTYFIGYARTPDVIEQMLRHMFLGDRPGVHDRILDFSRPVTGCLFHAPSADFLQRIV
ncbi:Dyp-type peroxidase [Streptomyces sp. SID5606]|uniref:Dyp-type peroxidase n=1 Tax=Streptomyces sp. SID5606 TaxID=2690305 RepID=UPI00136B84FB|nr:Dyp-type peroxidase [Streptomyces sp. SID5606]